MKTGPKNILRQYYRRKRSALANAFKQTASKQICHNILASGIYQSSTNIALYWSINGEVDLSTLWYKSCKQQKNCYFPVLNADKTLSFFHATPNSIFYKNHLGIPEPDIKSNRKINQEELDIMFLPLVAFDIPGNRLGMGGGYYDRTLSSAQPTWVAGAAYEFQRHDKLEPEQFDIPLSVIFTELNTYWRK